MTEVDRLGGVMEWMAWVSLLINLLVVVGLFVGRHWILARIARSVQYTFDVRLEQLRTDLRKGEEELKSDLRGKETEINALRDGVLSGRSQRQALLDKRRIEAVERVWSSIIALGPYKGVSGMMSVMNFEVVEKRVPHDPKLRSYFSMLIANIPEPDINGPESAAYRDRPFLSPLAWADFSAYSTVVMGGYAYAKLFGLGIEDAGRTLSHDAIREVLRATLPYRSDYIDQLGKLQFNLLLDDLERELLAELGNMLSGVDSDQASIARAAEITRAVKNAVDEADTNKAKNVDLA